MSMETRADENTAPILFKEETCPDRAVTGEGCVLNLGHKGLHECKHQARWGNRPSPGGWPKTDSNYQREYREKILGYHADTSVAERLERFLEQQVIRVFV